MEACKQITVGLFKGLNMARLPLPTRRLHRHPLYGVLLCAWNLHGNTSLLSGVYDYRGRWGGCRLHAYLT